MTRRCGLRAAVAVLLVLTAGCGTTAELTDKPGLNATLSGQDPAADASPVEIREFWDRTSNWEDPRARNVTVTSRTQTFHNVSGADAAVVYTTPKKPYVKADRLRSMSPVELATLATRAAAVSPAATDSRPGHTASLLDAEVTVHGLVDGDGATTGYVASVATTKRVVVVVVSGDADRRTVDRVLGAVTLSNGAVDDD